MGRYRLSALVGAAFLLPLSAGAWAADLPEIPPPTYQPPVQIGGSWYLRGDIGMTNQSVGSLYNVLYDSSTNTVTNISKVFESSPLWGLGIGYQHNEHLRFDLTGEYRGNATFHGLDIYTDTAATPTTGTDEYTAVKTELTFLANAYWDIGTWHAITPFVGGGVGASFNTIKGFTDVNTVTNGVAYGGTHSQWSLAWQLTAGLSYQVNPNVTIEAAYRYIDLGSAASGDLIAYDGTNTVYNPMVFRHLTSQDFKIGFRYAFGMPQYTGPAVVKY